MKRAKITVKGIVQGVGFRPFVFRLADSLGLKGYVLNTDSGVEIEVEGQEENIHRFLDKLKDPPPLALVESVVVSFHKPLGYTSFEIKESKKENPPSTLISPDIATCKECIKELFDPKDRRYLYPFINCTNCGPRFTIVKAIPYDRKNTTMSIFPMCPECKEEYENPRSRRFHAQPNACPRCGPRVWLVDAKGNKVEGEPLGKARRLLKDGRIIAVKGLGGFHLACNAEDDRAVLELRRRKKRDHKPFAVMCRDIEVARCVAELDKEAEELLTSKERPIVIVLRKRGLSNHVAPGRRDLGIMLPYTPLHHLLFDETIKALVMTSGNLSDEPICYENKEALERLKGIADYFLLHDRDIHIRCDDSVLRRWGRGFIFIRRSRGYVPRPVIKTKTEGVLAVGAHLKNTFCMLTKGYAFLSHHIGDLDNPKAVEAFEKGIEHFKTILEFEPELVACDAHPDYYSTKYAESLRLPLIKVQHHIAHALSCMAEWGLERAISVVMDGLGYGDDGNLWGCELFVLDGAGYKRLGHLKYIPMPGGDKASREVWRMGGIYLEEVFGSALDVGIPFSEYLKKRNWDMVSKAAKAGVNAPLVSSMGRLFDAISSIIHLRLESTYEGQAASELEQLAESTDNISYPFKKEEKGKTLVIDPAPIIERVVYDVKKGVSPSQIASRFHNSVRDMVVEFAEFGRGQTGFKDIVLSGGVFQNARLLSDCVNHLEKIGFKVFVNTKVPPNDGGISLGQAYYASLKRDC